ncbi:MAG: ATP-dependent sacrificial sulfur transferase LarE [Faecousia sp.]
MELEQFWKEHPKAAIAFSGGVDSAYLLYSAVKAGVQVKAYYAKTAFQPQFELEDARKLARQLGAPMEILPLDVLNVPHVAENPKNRCYYCKQALFTAITRKARSDGYTLLLDGTNASDQMEDRPGMQALRELSVRSPLRQCGLTKAEIRRRSKEAGLFTWDKPAYACLATRIPTGETITTEKLRRTEDAECFLTELGLRDFRVRSRGDGALLQVTREDLRTVLDSRETIVAGLKRDYEAVMLDLEVRP